MTTREKRKYSRTDSLNLINYIHYDEYGDEGNQGMGRTLNVSQAGILLETHSPVNVGHIISMTIGLKENVVEIKGRVKYSKLNDAGRFESGIQFIDLDKAAVETLSHYIDAFNENSTIPPQEI